MKHIGHCHTITCRQILLQDIVIVTILQALTKIEYNCANPEWNQELRVGLTVSSDYLILYYYNNV